MTNFEEIEKILNKAGAEGRKSLSEPPKALTHTNERAKITLKIRFSTTVFSSGEPLRRGPLWRYVSLQS